MPSEPNFITSEEFIELTKIELVTLFLLLDDRKLPTAYINKHLYVDINDERAKCWLPEAKKDLF
jgi:hypothetical protein